MASKNDADRIAAKKKPLRGVGARAARNLLEQARRPVEPRAKRKK